MAPDGLGDPYQPTYTNTAGPHAWGMTRLLGRPLRNWNFYNINFLTNELNIFVISIKFLKIDTKHDAVVIYFRCTTKYNLIFIFVLEINMLQLLFNFR